ncbi:MAG: YceD family protein [Pseudomonadota bacterium]|nr:YceD family protein [Pseudomonadota bacterium]
MDRHAHSGKFDALKLAATRGHIEGSVDPFDLDRVQDSLGDEEGEIPPSQVSYRIDGEVDAAGRPVLDVSLAGEVPMQCQRCLRLFTLPVQQRTTLLLARDEQELAFLDDSDEREVLLADAPLDALEVVSDELLLSLPYVPRCDRQDCVAATPEQPQEGVESQSAFAALAALKRPGKDADPN